jgi:arylesterase/paraoxonase
MSKNWRIASYVVLALVIVASVLAWRFLSAAGYFTGIRQEIAADCRVIEAVPGPEDIVIDHERGIAYVSAYDRRAVQAGAPGSEAVRGGLYAIDLKAPQTDWALYPVTPNAPADFRPHGIDLHVGADGARRLFAVSHPAAGPETVEIFDIARDGTLTHAKSVTDPLFVSINDVAAAGPDRFYVTNDHASKNGLHQLVSNILLLRNANVIYHDGTAARIAAGRFALANGIEASADGSEVYVADTMSMTLHVFERDLATGDLKGVDMARLGTGVDNIDVQPDGSLLIGAHPKLMDFLGHAGDPAALSPSQVVRVELGANGGGKAGTIYLDLGAEISGISVAAGYGDVMLLGQVFEPEVLACRQSKELKAW